MRTDHPTDAVVARLTALPWIETAAVDATGIRVRPAAAALASRPVPGALVQEYLEHWTEVYDFTYTDFTCTDSTCTGGGELAGWRASDTGEPLPAEHMAQWVDRTVELVLDAGPRHVLELGCGTGLLASRLIPHVEGYVGTDVAAATVARLAARGDAAFVTAAAHESGGAAVRAALERFPGGRPDCVLINSVTQCFPDVGYLTAVLQDAIALVAPGGTVVVGDNRHAGLLDHHCRWLERAADPGVAGDELARRAAARAGRDDELSFDPATLAAAAATSGRTVHMAVHPKTLAADTELTRYRFDAVLQVDPLEPVTAPPSVPWSTLPDLVAAVRRPARVTGIPHGLFHPDGATAHALREALTGTDAAVLLDDRDPTRLAVVSPATAAATDVTELAGAEAHTHEPLAAFVARRAGEVARSALRRAGLDPAGTTVTVETGDPVERAGRAAERAVADVDLAALPVFFRRLDDVAVRAMAATLGGGTVPGTEDSIAAALGVAPRHRWILRRWLAVLIAEGLLHADGDGYRDLVAVDRAALVGAAEEIDHARAGLGYPPEVTRFFQATVEYLPALLRDEVTLQSLLFADGETGTADGAYRDNPVNRYANAAVAELVRWHAEQVEPDGPLRLLELGAGVGATTQDVLTALGDRPVDYLFTDVSRFFLLDAEERFPGLRFATFDINAADNGLSPSSCDVVLGANVLHNARDIGATLRHLHGLLAPGGLLVFVETTREIHQLLTSMQFLMSGRPGHDRPGTADRRAGTDLIFLGVAEWFEELAGAGFTPLACLPAAGHPLEAIAVQVFAAVRR